MAISFKNRQTSSKSQIVNLNSQIFAILRPSECCLQRMFVN